MSKRVLLLLLLFFSILSLAQVSIKALYVMEIDLNNSFQTSSNPNVDCELFYQDGISRFYMYYDEAEKKYPNEIFKYRMSIYKNFTRNEMYGRAVGYKENEYIIRDSLNIIHWKINETTTKNIDGRVCKLATAKWRDHEWEAWYDESITISDGPYKLHGLPGLILEARAKNCNNSLYYFKIKKLELTNELFTEKVKFPFTNKDFKFVEYSKMYDDAIKLQSNNLKNNYLKSIESTSDKNIINDSSCVSSITFDFCLCYP